MSFWMMVLALFGCAVFGAVVMALVVLCMNIPSIIDDRREARSITSSPVVEHSF